MLPSSKLNYRLWLRHRRQCRQLKACGEFEAQKKWRENAEIKMFQGRTESGSWGIPPEDSGVDDAELEADYELEEQLRNGVES